MPASPVSFRRLLTGPTLAALILSVPAPARCETANPEPTVAEARAFIADAEERLRDLWERTERIAWVKANFITDDTNALAATAQEELLAVTAELSARAARFDGLVEMPAEITRKLHLLKISVAAPAPRDRGKQGELARLTTEMGSLYGTGRFCDDGGECRDLSALSRVFAASRDAAELEEAWTGWRTVAPPMRDMYRRFVELANEGARELGFADLGAMWRSGYDMPPDAFAAELDRLWQQVRPLYDALHCHVRRRLAETYGSDVVAPGDPIPAHLLGNMWSQQWGNIYDLVAPKSGDPGFDLTRVLREKELDAAGMVRYGERFFTSLGFDPLPDTFWTRSLFTRPADREVTCHASAWNIDNDQDLRIKMCIEINEEDFHTIHHELGHNIYQRAYRHQSPLFWGGANDGFHEGIGDTISLSITPDYLAQVGLLQQVPSEEADLGLLMRMALDKIAFLPFGLMVDQWRWKVFSGDIAPGEYNREWWKLRRKYQGIAPPVKRSEADFDPGAKYHVPANTPYTRYFLAHILQFQFHRSLCAASGFEGPLNRCSIYGNARAGKKLAAMLEMGLSKPWPEALEALTGSPQMDATAILDYFKPLMRWLERENQNDSCGWS